MLKLATIRKEFTDEQGAGTDAWYTIRKRLSYDAQQRYAAQLSAIDLDLPKDATDQDRQAAFRALSPEDRKLMAQISTTLLGDALMRLEGVRWDDDTEVTIERFGGFDEFYVGQVVNEIQAQNNKATEKQDPNSDRPSSD